MSIDYTISSSNSDNEENMLTVDSIEISLGCPIPISIKPSEYLISSIKLLKIPSYKKAQLITIVQNRDIQKTYVSLFWLVFCKKLRNDSTQIVQQYLSEKLTKKYVKLTLNKLQVKSNDAYDFLPLILSYGVHHQMWDIFAGSRKIFDTRFVYDCYQIVLLELLGTPVTDLFVKNYTDKAFGSNFLKYTHIKEKIDPSKLGPPIHIQEKASKIEGGKELVYEIYTKLRQSSYRSGNQSYRSNTPDVKLNGGDLALQKVVNSHIAKTPNGAAFAEKVQENKFNCVSLSPLLSRHLQIPSKQVPFKNKHLTPHTVHRNNDEVPTFVKLLQDHVEKKKKSSNESLLRKRQHSDQFDRKNTEYRMKKNFKLDQGISRQGIEHSQVLVDVFKMKNKLKEMPSFASLYNKSKSKLV